MTFTLRPSCPPGQMPYTTPSLPPSVSAPAPSAPAARSSADAHRPLHAAEPAPPPQPTERAPSGATPADRLAAALAGTALKPAAAASAPPQKPAAPFSRRSTLTSRFPLLRKTSREAPGHHLRGNSVSTPPAHPDSPFLSTGAPRASLSSQRGRPDPPADEPRIRAPSANPSVRSHVREPDSSQSASPVDTLSPPSTVSTPNTSSDSELTDKLEKAQHHNTPKAAKAGDKKMHQTSSRLLRMTDDERPFTRVSVLRPSPSGREPLLPSCRQWGRPRLHACR